MSATKTKKKAAVASQMQKKPHRGTQNLIPFKPGQSGNPGGRIKGTQKVSNIYARLLQMPPDEIAAFVPTTGAEQLALVQYKNAHKGKPRDTLAATKEITDRTEGRAPQRIVLDNTSELEKLIIRVQERVLAQTKMEITREQAVELITAYRPALAETIE